MYIMLSSSKSSKDKFVYLMDGYRDKDGKSKKRIIKSYGSLNKLLIKNPNILDELKLEAKQLTKQKKETKDYYHVFLDPNKETQSKSSPKNIGYFHLESIYDSLGITKLVNELQKAKTNSSYNLDSILKLLVFSRALKPASKQETINKQSNFFIDEGVNLHDTYRSLELLSEFKEEIEAQIHNQISKQYKRDCSLVFYDVTNYYFESEVTIGYRQKGPSKELKKTGIVQMGLFIDSFGIPISYDLFPGNMHDSKTLIPSINKMRKKFNLGKITLTADKGLNSNSNLSFLVENNDNYIVSQKIRGSKESFIKEVLCDSGYTYNNNKTFKLKSFIRPRKLENGKIIDEQVICFWSKDFSDREKHKRAKLLDKIEKMIKTPSLLKASNSYGIKKYLDIKQIDKKTGESLQASPKITFKQDKYKKDESLDGYYVIITNDLSLTPTQVIQKYRGLWRIEESFRVIKHDLEGRPVYVRNDERVDGHFLTCFIALTVMRILEHKLKNKYSVAKIQEALNSATATLIEKDIYLISDPTNTYKEMMKEFNLSFNKKYALVEEIRKYRKKIV